MSGEGEGVPTWAANLRETVARIDERTKQIDHIATAVENLRQTTVPMSEHQHLMDTVAELEKRDLGARGEWDEMVPRVRLLWQERSEGIGARRLRRAAGTLLGTAVALATLYNVLHDAGLVSLGPHP